jgi:hypothetical protein
LAQRFVSQKSKVELTLMSISHTAPLFEPVSLPVVAMLAPGHWLTCTNFTNWAGGRFVFETLVLIVEMILK